MDAGSHSQGQFTEPSQPQQSSDAATAVGDHHSTKVQLFATGLNAHDQLSATQEGKDVPSLAAITSPTASDAATLLFAGWSSTILQIGSQIMTLGHQRWSGDQVVQTEAGAFFDAFGDHEGMLGCLDSPGRIWLAMPSGLECLADPDGSPLIGHIALAGNGKVAITFKQAPNGRLCHVLCFDSFDDLQEWYCDPAGVSYDAEKQHFMMQGQPRQLLAGTGTFLLRMESGEVLSWGDPRYSSLGRSIADAPAERPSLVEALGGLKIKKVACGGWLNAALSEDRACYLWGTGMPGTDLTIRCLREASAGEVVLVELSGESGGEPLDVLDVAVGDNHIVLLAEGNRLFAVGASKNGQLGLGHFDPFVDEWTPVPLGDLKLHSIMCGPKSTYAFAASST